MMGLSDNFLKRPGYFRKLRRNELGSFTIEASLVFPVIFITTVSLLFMSIFVYQKAITYSTASLVAERTAFSWDNSHKNPVNGAFYIEEYDPLYWRNFDDSVSDMFQFLYSHKASHVQFSTYQKVTEESSLPQRKLAKAIKFIPGGFNAQITYINHLINREISVQLQSPFKIPSFIQNFFGKDVVISQASSKVTEPVEYIRNINLTRTYLPLIEKELNLPQLNKILNTFRHKTNKQETPTDNYKLSFESHAKAKIYLQKLVKGKSVTKSTTDEGKWRLIDALDRDNIAHQAYFGSKTKDNDMLFQMNKDVEIMRKGDVSGIVWHFFRRKSDGSIGPSKSLEKELQKRGIVIVIHD